MKDSRPSPDIHAVPVKTIHLATSTAAYDILIGHGLLTTLHPRLQRLMAGKPYRPFLITSPAIWQHWSAHVRQSFPEARSPIVLFLPSGEKHKRLASVESLAEQLARHGADRDALLLAFGGGIVGDITGFLAAIYMRGIPYVQIPTTFLAQVDSSVGGKTGVNLASGKNLVGSFHQPLAVLADTAVLSTLPLAELTAGMQESIKAAIIRDKKLFCLRRSKETSCSSSGMNPFCIASSPLPSASRLKSSLKMKKNPVRACCSTSAIPWATPLKPPPATRFCCTARPLRGARSPRCISRSPAALSPRKSLPAWPISSSRSARCPFPSHG